MNKQVLKLSPLTEASFYILLSFTAENHGYGVIKKVKEMTNNRLILATGTLYGVINTLLKNNLIILKETTGTRSKKTYEITNIGKELLLYEQKRLQEMLQNSKEVLQ